MENFIFCVVIKMGGGDVFGSFPDNNHMQYRNVFPKNRKMNHPYNYVLKSIVLPIIFDRALIRQNT